MHGGVWHHGANVQGRSDGAFAAVLVVEDDHPSFRLRDRRTTTEPRVACGTTVRSPTTSGFGFSRHGGVWHHGANAQGRSDGAFAAVLVVEDEVPFSRVAIGAPPPSPRSVQGRRDVPN